MLRVHFGVEDLARTRFHGGNGQLWLGIGEALNSLHPRIKWNSPALEVDLPLDRDVHLNGRGLVLRGFGGPFRLVVEDVPQPVLCYPAPAAQLEGLSADALSGVLGRTRAGILRALDVERTTTDLARTVGVSLATASEGASALREAGLVTTRRDGRAVRHRMTRRGWDVVRG